MRMNSNPPPGDEENPHDQLPSPEEYRANMDDGTMSSMRDNPQDRDDDDDDDDHDLPTVDEYKSNMSFRESEERPKCCYRQERKRNQDPARAPNNKNNRTESAPICVNGGRCQCAALTPSPGSLGGHYE